MTNGDARSELDREMDEILARNREAFLGKYKDEINELSGLSRDDIDAITPGTTDFETYNAGLENDGDRTLAIGHAATEQATEFRLSAKVEDSKASAVRLQFDLEVQNKSFSHLDNFRFAIIKKIFENFLNTED